MQAKKIRELSVESESLDEGILESDTDKQGVLSTNASRSLIRFLQSAKGTTKQTVGCIDSNASSRPQRVSQANEDCSCSVPESNKELLESIQRGGSL